jgi:hypothetical protein
MEYDKEKVDEMILALLYLTSSTDQFGTRAWKAFDWQSMDRLFKKGYISNPHEKGPTLALSEAGAEFSKQLFNKYFSKDDAHH